MSKTSKLNASKVYKYMRVGKRSATDDAYYYFDANTLGKMRDAWQTLTSDYGGYSFADLDEYYRVLYKLVETMHENDNFTEDDIYAIDWADVYNADRLDWVKENLNRAYIYPDVMDNGSTSLFDALGNMQQQSRSEFASHIYNTFLEVI